MATKTLLCGADTFIRGGGDSGVNFGGRSYMLAGKDSSGIESWGLVWFPAHGIPVGSIINSATLWLYNYDTANDWAASVSIGVSGVAGYWETHNVTWGNAPSKTGTSSYRTVSGVNNGWLSWDVSGLFRQMLAGTVHYDWGFYIFPNNADWRTVKSFYTMEGSSAYKAQLVIDYTTPTKPSAPTTFTVTPSLFEDSVTLNWSGAKAGTSNQITGYSIYRSVNGGAYALWRNISSTSTSGSATDSSSISRGNTVRYQIWTKGTVEDFLWSDEKLSNTATRNLLPNTPAINYPVSGSTVYNRRPRILLTAAARNDGPEHYLRFNDGSWWSTKSNGSLFSSGTNENLGSNRKLVFRKGSDYTVGSKTFRAEMNDSLVIGNSVSRTFTMATLSVTDATLVAGTTKIRAVHITQLQAAIGNLRTAYGLSSISWQSCVANTTPIANAHSLISQMQTALQGVINTINSWDTNNSTFNIPTVSWKSVTSTVDGSTGVDPKKLREAIEQLRDMITTI